MLARRGSGAGSKPQTHAAGGKGGVLTQGKISRYEEPPGAPGLEEGSHLVGKGVPFMKGGTYGSGVNMNHAIDQSRPKIARRTSGGEYAMAGNLKIDTNPSKMGQKDDGDKMMFKEDKNLGFPIAKNLGFPLAKN